MNTFYFALPCSTLVSFSITELGHIVDSPVFKGIINLKYEEKERQFISINISFGFVVYSNFCNGKQLKVSNKHIVIDCFAEESENQISQLISSDNCESFKDIITKTIELYHKKTGKFPIGKTFDFEGNELVKS